MSNVRDELQRWVEGDSWADQGYESELIPVDLARRVLAEMDATAHESECRRVTYANLYATYLATRNEKWSNECAPGGMVCAECGVPVESEPCELHGGGLDVAEKVRGQMHEALNRVTDITIERDAAQAILAEVRAEHQPDGDYGYQSECVACRTQWPCTTSAILDRSKS